MPLDPPTVGFCMFALWAGCLMLAVALWGYDVMNGDDMSTRNEYVWFDGQICEVYRIDIGVGTWLRTFGYKNMGTPFLVAEGEELRVVTEEEWAELEGYDEDDL